MIPVQRRYREGVVWGRIVRRILSLLILFHWVVLMAAVNEIHAFYYMWYGNVSFDGRWKHWDHEILPHWQSSVNLDFPQIGKRHHPPGSLHSPFYPLRGPYSSSDPFIISSHFHEMRDAGIGVAVLSWWGQRSRPESRDTQGVSTDEIIPLILATASALDGISVAFHLEPYPGRTAQSTAEDLRYLHEKYGDSKALYRINGKMVFYIYDSYHISSSDWAKYLTPQGKSYPPLLLVFLIIVLADDSGERTIRGSQYDSFVIGLWLDRLHGEQLHSAGFDGIYSYFASDGFSFGSTTANWKSMCEYAKKVWFLFFSPLLL
jgi:glycoprotein endo-alpha-1,2-mannosidase